MTISRLLRLPQNELFNILSYLKPDDERRNDDELRRTRQTCKALKKNVTLYQQAENKKKAALDAKDLERKKELDRIERQKKDELARKKRERKRELEREIAALERAHQQQDEQDTEEIELKFSAQQRQTITDMQPAEKERQARIPLLDRRIKLLNRFLTQAREEKEQKSWFSSRIYYDPDPRIDLCCSILFMLLGIAVAALAATAAIAATASGNIFGAIVCWGTAVFLFIFMMQQAGFKLDQRGPERFDSHPLSSFTQTALLMEEIQREFSTIENNPFIGINNNTVEHACRIIQNEEKRLQEEKTNLRRSSLLEHSFFSESKNQEKEKKGEDVRGLDEDDDPTLPLRQNSGTTNSYGSTSSR